METESEPLYHLKYKLIPGEFSKTELQADDDWTGGCDAIFVASIRRGPGVHEGEKSIMFIHLDGYTKSDLPVTELFQVWAQLAKTIGEGAGPGWQRALARQTFETVKDFITR